MASNVTLELLEDVKRRCKGRSSALLENLQSSMGSLHWGALFEVEESPYHPSASSTCIRGTKKGN